MLQIGRKFIVFAFLVFALCVLSSQANAQSWTGPEGSLTVVSPPISVEGESPIALPGQALGQVVVADFNGDGMADLAAVVDNSLVIYRGNGKGRFSRFNSEFANYVESITAGDFNGDGYQDIIFVGHLLSDTREGLFLLAGRGDGTFNSPVQLKSPDLPELNASCLIAVGPFAQHSVDDIALACGAAGHSTIYILENDSKGSIKKVRPVYSSIQGRIIIAMSAGDTLGGGINSLLIQSKMAVGEELPQTDLLENKGLLFNLKRGIVASAGKSTLADYDGDGLADILSVTDTQVLAFHNGHGSFDSATTLIRTQSCTSQSIMASDLQGIPGSLALDLVISELCGGSPSISAILNDSGTRVRLTVTKSNSDESSYTFGLNVLALLGSDTPSGKVIVEGSGLPETMTLTNGAAAGEVNWDGKRGTGITAYYLGSTSFAASWTSVVPLSASVIQALPEKASLSGSSIGTSSDLVKPKPNLIEVPPLGDISTIAGNGTAGNTNNGGQASGAEISSPEGLRLDPSGNIFFVDGGNNEVKEIFIATGVISIVAGNGTAGCTGTGSAASSADITPSAIVIDGSGNLYIGESGCADVRKVTISSGMISAFAGNGSVDPDPSSSNCQNGDGGSATSAELCTLSSLAFDSSNNLYVGTGQVVRDIAGTGRGDRSNGYDTYASVRKVTTAGIISSPYATSAAALESIADLIVDGSGNLYISDGMSNDVEKCSMSSCVTYNVGSPTQVGGLGIDSSSNLYVVDTGSCIIRKTLTSGSTSIIAGNGTCNYSGDGGTATSAEVYPTTVGAHGLFQFGSEVSVSTSGSVYIGDTKNNRIRMIGGASLTPSLSVACTPNPITYGSQTTNCTSSLIGGSSPTGTITWTINGGAWVTSGINGSEGGFAGWSAGNYIIGVAYSGDVNNNAVSNSTTLTIAQVTPTVAVSCTPNPVTYGGSQSNCTISVSGSATGTVAVTYNGNSWTTQTLASGSAVVGWSSTFGMGPYIISAAYSGDGNYNAATGSTTITINKATPGVSISCSPTPIIYGQSTTCSASVGGGATGIVTFLDNGNPWATPTLSSGTASATGFSSNTPQNYTVEASYGGDVNNNAVSASTMLTITQATPSVSFNTLPSSTTYGNQTTTSVQVSCNSACGNVDFRFDGGEWGIVPLNSSGYFSASRGPDSAGTHTVQVNFLGNGNYNAVSPASQSITITQVPTVTTIESSNNPSNYGQSTNLTALVNTGGTVPTGSMTFMNGGSSIGTGTVSTVSTTNLVPSSGQIGNSAWGGYCEASATQVVNTPAVLAPDGSQTATYYVMPSTYSCGGLGDWGSLIGIPGGLIPGTVYTVSVWLRGANGGESVIFGINDGYMSNVVTLSTSWQRFSITFPSYVSNSEDNRGFQLKGTDTSQVFYAWGAQTEAAASVGPYVNNTSTSSSQSGSGGVATLTTSSLPVGADSLTAVYGGDVNDSPSTSLTLTQTVTDASSTISVATSGTPSTFGGSVIFTATVTGGASGTVTFYDGGSSIGTGAISGTTATLGTSTLAAGSHTITASWPGNTDYSAATSAAMTQVVSKATPTVPSWPTASGITFGQTLAASTLTGGTASVAGTFVWTTPSTAPGVGTAAQSVTFTPTDATDYNTPTAGSVNVTVAKTTPGVLLASSLNPSTYATSVTFTATVSSGATGTITFYDGGTAIGVAPIVGTSAMLATNGLNAGSHPITAQYNGDSNDNNSTSGIVAQVVNQAVLTVNGSSSLTPSSYGDSVTITFNFSGGGAIPAGTATITQNGSAVATAGLDGTGKVTYTTSTLGAGSHSIVATYNGSTNYY